MNQIKLSLLIALAGLFAACSNSNKDDIEIPNKDKDKLCEIGVKLDVEDYGEEEVIQARSGRKVAPETVFQEAKDLGNGITAVVTMKKDTVKPAPKTRAGGADEETCTFVVFKGNTVVREVSGKMNRAGGWITDASGKNVKLLLPPDTYKLVCYNDKITRNGTKFTVKKDANLEDAYMGVNTNFVLTPVTPANPRPRDFANMRMKHVCSRLRFTVMSYYDMAASDMTVSGQTAADSPKSSSYDLATEQWSTEEGGSDGYDWAYPAEVCDFDEYAVVGKYNSKFQAFLPSVQLSKLKVTFNSGNTYKRNISGLTFNLSSNKKLELGGQYRVDVFLLYNFLYLYNDGSVGYPKEARVAGGTKIPVAVVLSQSQRLAIGLAVATGGNKFSISSYQYSSVIANSAQFPSLASAVTDMNGYGWTYGNSPNGFGVKAYNNNFPAFFACGKYTLNKYVDENITTVYATVPLTNNLAGKKWHLGSVGEWAYAYRVLGLGTDNLNSTEDYQDAAWDAKFFYSAFRQMGFANKYVTLTYNSIPTSTEYSSSYNWHLEFSRNSVRFKKDGKSVGYGFMPFIRY